MALNLTYKIKTENKIDLCKNVLTVYCALKDIRLSKRELLIISSFILEGYNHMTKEALISSKMVKNMNAMGNLLHKFRGYGFLTQVRFKEDLHQDLLDMKGVNSENLVLISTILDNRV